MKYWQGILTKIIWLCLLLVIWAVPISSETQAASYRCDVERKLNGETVYSQAYIQKYQYTVLIQDRGETATLSRCSFVQNAGKITCDSYEVDKIVSDPYVFIKKYYVFRSQFDVQIFKNLSFVENNGRGTVAYGTCVLVAP